MNDAIKELFDIIELESTGSLSGSEHRKRELLLWLDRWVDSYQETQLLLNSSTIYSDVKDSLKLKLAYDIILKFLEDNVEVVDSKHRLKANVSVLRRRKRR
jgi:hypothetical protein